MAEMHTHTHTHTQHTQRIDGAVFRWNFSAFLRRSPWVKMFPGLYDFPATSTILVVTRPSYTSHVGTPMVWYATCTTSAILPLRKYLRTVWKRGVLSVAFLLLASASSTMTPKQFTRHFCWGICVLFTLGNRSITWHGKNGFLSQYSTWFTEDCGN